MEGIIGRHCQLLRPVRDPRSGMNHFHENPVILLERQLNGRLAYLVRFANNDESYVFSEEVEIDE